MVFTDTAIEYFSLIGSRVRAGFAESNSATPFDYEEESFHSAYEAITQIWKRRQSIRSVAEEHEVSRDTVKRWQQDFVSHGAIGLLAEIAATNLSRSPSCNQGLSLRSAPIELWMRFS